jgi:hypothetical protein
MLVPHRDAQPLSLIRFKTLWLLVCVLALVLSACARASQPVFEPSPSVSDTPQPLKISLASPGMVRIPKAKLGAGWGSALDHPENLHLSYRDMPVPFWVDAAGEALNFYTQPSDSLYTQESVYILSVEELPEPLSQPEVASTSALPELPPDLPPGGYYAFQREETNQLYLPQAELAEHWFWESLSAPASQVFEIQATDLLSQKAVPAGLAQLTVALWSGTESPKSPDHHLRVLLNGQLVADEQWDGKGEHRVQAEFDPSLLQPGVNQVTLDAPGDTAATVDQNYLDWVELRYPRQLRAQLDRLDFWSPGGSLKLEGFSGEVAVYDITDPLKAESMQINGQGEGSLTLETQAGRRYQAVGPAGYQDAVSIVPLTTQPDLRAAGIGADYAAVGPVDLLEPLQPLLDYRAGEGLKVMAVPLEAVYDQFNGGVPEPQAIQRWMQFAAQRWQPVPRYLLLVGDATYDPKGYIAPQEANRLPAFLVDTLFGGQSASDVGFVQIDGDDLPDLALGRLPARTPEQVAAIVMKTLAYERALDASQHQHNVLAVADGQEPSFKMDAEAWLEQFPATIQTELIAPAPGVSNTADQIRERLNQGEWLVAYFGHGSLNMWGKDRLFTAEDAAGLDNITHLPVILNMTCLTGLFTHPKVESLTEALLFNPSGGAAAVLAPSSLTLAYDQSFLSQPLVTEILAHPESRLGEVHLAARRQVALDTPGKRDVMMTFMLFGDPALRLSAPAQ